MLQLGWEPVSPQLFVGAITWSFSYGYARQKNDDGKKYTSFTGHFNGRGDVPVRYGMYCPIRKVPGLPFLWTLLDVAIRQVFTPYRPGRRHGHQCWRQNRVVALCNCIPKLALKKAQNRLSTQLIKVTSLVKKVEYHDLSQRARLSFQLSNTNNGQKLLKLLITKEAH